MSKLYQNEYISDLYKNRTVLNRLYSTITQPIWKRQYPRGAWKTYVFSYHVIQTETPDKDTALPLMGVLVMWYGRINNIINYMSIKNEKLKLKNYSKT